MRTIKTYNYIKIRSILIFCLLCFSFANIQAQSSSDLQLWEKYSMRFFVSKYRIWIRNDIDFRQALLVNPSQTYALRPRLIINIGNLLDFQPGIDLWYVNSNDMANTTELRTWQGVRLHWPDIGRVMFEHFYRFEQRFVYTSDDSGKEMGLRSRYRLQVRTSINNSSLTDKTFYCDLRTEFYFPHDHEVAETFASTVRAGVNIGYNKNYKWRYFASFLVDRVKNTAEQDRLANNYIISLTLRNMF